MPYRNESLGRRPMSRAVAVGGVIAALVVVIAAGSLQDARASSSVTVSSAIPVVALAQVEIDLAKVKGPETCGECHTAEYEAWKKTHHATTLNTMHKNPSATKIIEAMGLTGRIKTNDLCYKCHYTSQVVDGERKVIGGVSCESCHGAARDWTSEQLHHEKAKDASGSEKEAIYAKCEAAGMIRPANIYNVARNCFSCHTVPNEKLVNVGGHKAGSAFELVAWSQGEVRHNYQHSDDKSNRPASPARLRVLYVVGAMTDLEFGLRGLAKATEGGSYVNAMVDRVNSALLRLDKIAEAKIPEVAEALAAVPRRDDTHGVRVKLSSVGTMAAVADKVSAAAEKFSRTNDGSGLAAIDGLLPKKTMGDAQP